MMEVYGKICHFFSDPTEISLLVIWKMLTHIMKVSARKKQVIKKLSQKSLWQTYMKLTVVKISVRRGLLGASFEPSLIEKDEHDSDKDLRLCHFIYMFCSVWNRRHFRWWFGSDTNPVNWTSRCFHVLLYWNDCAQFGACWNAELLGVSTGSKLFATLSY